MNIQGGGEIIFILRDKKYVVHNQRWDGTTTTRLKTHIEQYRDSYVEWETASLHITDQVLNEFTRVQSLLDSIYGCTDTKMCARVMTGVQEAIIADYHMCRKSKELRQLYHRFETTLSIL